MRFLIQTLIAALAVMVSELIIPGIHVNSFFTGVLVALVFSFLNALLKPILVILTLPITVLTFGLFLLVINALMVMLAGKIVPGFTVDGFWWAVLFSIILSIVTGIFQQIDEK